MQGQHIIVNHKSPLEHQTFSKKQYSYSEMKQWCQQFVEYKTSQLLKQINQNNAVIKILSEKVKHLQLQLNHKQSIQSQNKTLSNNRIIEIMNNLINSKLRDLQENIQAKFKSLEISKDQYFKVISKRSVQTYQEHMENKINTKIGDIKLLVKQRLEQTEINNTQYWTKIKAWLKKLQGKLTLFYDKNIQIQKGLSKIQDDISKSLLNIYRLRNITTRINQIQISVYDLEQSFKNVIEYQGEHKFVFQNMKGEPLASNILLPSPISNQKQDKLNLSIQQPQIIQTLQKVSPLNLNIFNKSQRSRIRPYTSYCSNTITVKNTPRSSNLKNRIIQLSKQKNIQLPLICYRDQFGYLKNNMNNYLFDLSGNMFKTSILQFQQMSKPSVGLIKLI